jgi:hypothetical protein
VRTFSHCKFPTAHRTPHKTTQNHTRENKVCACVLNNGSQHKLHTNIRIFGISNRFSPYWGVTSSSRIPHTTTVTTLPTQSDLLQELLYGFIVSFNWRHVFSDDPPAPPLTVFPITGFTILTSLLVFRLFHSTDTVILVFVFILQYNKQRHHTNIDMHMAAYSTSYSCARMYVGSRSVAFLSSSRSLLWMWASRCITTNGSPSS